MLEGALFGPQDCEVVDHQAEAHSSRLVAEEGWCVRELEVPVCGQVFEEPLLAECPRLGETVVRLVNGAVERIPVEEAVKIVELKHVGWDQVALDADVFGVGQRGTKIKVTDVDGRPVRVLRNHCVDEQF